MSSSSSLPRQLAGEVQQDVLVAQVVDVELLRRIREHDVVRVRCVKLVAGASEFGALPAAAVPAEQVVASLRGRSEPTVGSSGVHAQLSVELVKPVRAARFRGIHPARIVLSIQRLIPPQIPVHYPDVVGRLVVGLRVHDVPHGVPIRTDDDIKRCRPASERMRMAAGTFFCPLPSPSHSSRVSVGAGGRGGPGRRLVLNGHLDTFPIGGAPWTHPPLGGDLEDERIYGRGACDMKAGVAPLVFAFVTLAEFRDAWCGELVLAFADDEETGGPWGTRYRLANVEEAVAGVMLNADTGSPWLVRTGEKGNVWVEIEARGGCGSCDGCTLGAECGGCVGRDARGHARA